MSQIDTTLSLIQTLGSADMFDYIEVSLCFAIGVMQSLEEITISRFLKMIGGCPGYLMK